MTIFKQCSVNTEEADTAAVVSLIWTLTSISSPLGVEDMDGEVLSLQQVQHLPTFLGDYG